MRDLGADEVINYREQDVGEVLKGQDYDLVLDCVGGEEYWKAAQKLLKKGEHDVPLYVLDGEFPIITTEEINEVLRGHTFSARRTEF